MSMQHDVLTEPYVEEAVDRNGAVAAGGEVSGVAGGGPVSLPLPPLTVSALLVTKADLIRGLRVYLPQLADIEPLDRDRFLLHVGPGADAAAGPDAPAGPMGKDGGA